MGIKVRLEDFPVDSGPQEREPWTTHPIIKLVFRDEGSPLVFLGHLAKNVRKELNGNPPWQRFLTFVRRTKSLDATQKMLMLLFPRSLYKEKGKKLKHQRCCGADRKLMTSDIYSCLMV